MSDSESSSNALSRPTKFAREHPRVDLIFNVVSGTGDPDEDLTVICGVLEESFADVKVWKTTPEKAGEELGREAIADGATVLIASGGDGTVAGVACALQEAMDEGRLSQPVLAVVPRGTANALCAALGIPSDVKASAKLVCEGGMRRIDVPEIEHSEEGTPKAMMLLCGIGLEAKTVKSADRGLKRTLGVLAYAFAGLKSTWSQKAFSTDLVLYDVDDSMMFAGGRAFAKEMHLKDMMLKGVTIANAAPASSVLAQGVGEVRPDDGLVEVVCISSRTPLGLLQTMATMLKSALTNRRERRGKIFGMRARKVEIICDPPQPIVIDGEAVGMTPITVGLNTSQGQLEIIAPTAGAITRRKRKVTRALIRFWRNARGASLLAVTVAVLRRTRAKPRSSYCDL